MPFGGYSTLRGVNPNLKKSGKMLSNLLQKLFPFSSKSSFRILDIQISWRHQMPKHRIRNTFYWITWEVNIVCKWNLTSWCHITKEKMWSKSSIKTATWKLIQGLFALTENYPKFKDLSLLELNLWSELLILDMEIVQLSKFVQISLQASSDSFSQSIFGN